MLDFIKLFNLDIDVSNFVIGVVFLQVIDGKECLIVYVSWIFLKVEK